MQLTQSVQSPNTNHEKQSIMHRIQIAIAKNETKIAMITGASAGFIGGVTTRRRVLQGFLGAVVPLVAFAYLSGE
jgi:cell division protein FtsX